MRRRRFWGARLWSLRGTAVAGAWGACLAVWLAYVASGAAWFWWYVAVPLGGVAGVAAIGLPRSPGARALRQHGRVRGRCGPVVPGLYTIRANAEWSAFGGAAEYLAANAHGRGDGGDGADRNGGLEVSADRSRTRSALCRPRSPPAACGARAGMTT